MNPAKTLAAPFFADKKLNDEFNRYGYVVVKLLSDEGIKQLTDFYVANPNPFQAEFHTTHFATDKAFKKKVHEAITRVLEPAFKHYLPDHDAVFGNFMVKEPGGNNPMPLHADWTYVDESRTSSIAIWMPLIDTTPENGQLGVIPFSQHLSYHIRGPRIKQWEFPFNETLIKSMGKILPVKAGEAVIYDHRLLHFSPANNSSQVRPAINLSIAPKNVQLIHYTVPEGKEGVHRYEVDNLDFFIYYDNFQLPERGKLTNIDMHSIPMLNDRVNAFINKYAKPGFIERIKAWF